MSTKLIHKEDRLKNILAVCDPKSKGYEELKKISRLGDVNPRRIDYLRAFDSSAEDVTKRSLIARGNTISTPQTQTDGVVRDMQKPMDREVRNKTLQKLAVSIIGNEVEIIECKTWSAFMESRDDHDIMKNRTFITKQLNEVYRKPFTNLIHTSDMPTDYRDLHLAYIRLPSSIAELIKSNKDAEKEYRAHYQNEFHVKPISNTSKGLLDTYFTIQENEIDVERCDFFDGIITFERIIKEHGLELTGKLKEISTVGKLFETNIHAVALGKKRMYVLQSPLMLIEQWQNSDNRRSGTATSLRLHSVTDPAYDSPDTGPIHYIHGVYFTKNLWDKIISEKFTLKDYASMDSNMEQKRIITDNDWFADLLKWHKKAKYTPKMTPEQRENKDLQRSEHGNCLIKIPGFISANAKGNDSRVAIDLVIVNYTDPSTGREYNSFVDPSIDDPDEAMAWKFGFNDADDYYNSLVAEG